MAIDEQQTVNNDDIELYIDEDEDNDQGDQGDQMGIAE